MQPGRKLTTRYGYVCQSCGAIGVAGTGMAGKVGVCVCGAYVRVSDQPLSPEPGNLVLEPDASDVASLETSVHAWPKVPMGEKKAVGELSSVSADRSDLNRYPERRWFDRLSPGEISPFSPTVQFVYVIGVLGIVIATILLGVQLSHTDGVTSPAVNGLWWIGLFSGFVFVNAVWRGVCDIGVLLSRMGHTVHRSEGRLGSIERQLRRRK